MVRGSTFISPKLPENVHHSSRRSELSHAKKCHLSCFNSTLLPKQSIFSSEENGQLSSRYRSFSSQSVHLKLKVQDDESGCCSQSNSARGMGDNIGHTRCIPAYSNPTVPPQVFGLHAKRATLFFQSSTLRTGNSSKDIHHDHEMALTVTAPAKYTTASISRRPLDLGSIGNPNASCDLFCNEDFEGSRIPVKLSKINNNTLSTVHLAGDIILHSNNDMVHSNGKTAVHAKRGQQPDQLRVRHQKNMGKFDWSSSIFLSGGKTPQTNILPLGETTGVWPDNIQGPNTENSPTSITCIDSLDEIENIIPSASLENTGSNSHNLDGCVFGRMGLPNFRQSSCSRQLVSRRENSEHQSPRVIGNPEGNGSVKVKPREPTRIYRQRNCPILHKQNGKPKHPNPSSCQADNGVDRTSQPNDSRSQNSLQSERSSGSPQSLHCTTNRMGTINEHIQLDSGVAWDAQGRHDGNSNEHQTPQLHLSLRSSKGGRGGCSINRLERVSRYLHFSSSKSDPKTNSPSEEIQREGGDHSAVAPHGTMVPYNLVKSKRSFTPVQKRLSNGIRERNIRRLQILRKVDRFQFLKQIWSNKYDKVTSEQLSLSSRKSSSNQYQSVWRCFQKWLPVSVKVLSKVHILRFLIWLHKKKKLSSKTVLSYRGALALPLQMGFGINTKDKDFNLLARAQFLNRPAPKKKVPSWSLNHALEFFKQPRFNNHRASVKDLFLKCIFLTAIASGNRVSELSACVREGTVQSRNSLTIPVKDKFLYKNQRANSSPNSISFPSLPRQELCPVACLLKYIKLTEKLPHNNSLFIHPSSNKPLKSGRLSYWLVQALKLATPNFKGTAHEIRGQAYSAAWARGVPMERILKEGFWFTPNVFIDNYLCSMDSLITPFIGGRHIIKP